MLKAWSLKFRGGAFGSNLINGMDHHLMGSGGNLEGGASLEEVGPWGHDLCCGLDMRCLLTSHD